MSEMILIFRGAIDNLSYQYAALLRVLMVPLIFLLIIEHQILPDVTGRFWVRTITFVYILVYGFCMLSMFRILITGSHAVPRWGVYTISKSSVYFILYIVCLFIVLYALSYFLFSSLPPPVNWVLFFILKVYLLARIVLVFPAISVNTYFSFTSSWRRTRNHQVIMLMVASAVVLLREASKLLSNELLSGTVFFSLMIEIAVWTFILALLSETFKTIQIKNSAARRHSGNSIVG